MPFASARPLLAAAALLFASSAARAAEPPPPPPKGAAPPSPASEEISPDELPEGGIPPGSFVWRPWMLFDPYLARREAVASFGLLTEDRFGGDDRRRGFSLGFGPSIETRRGPLLTRGQVTYGLRLTGGDHLVLQLGRYSYSGGLTLGPFEATARVGLTVFDFHIGPDHLGLGLLSPHVGAGVALDLGQLRLSANAVSEVSWRWLGGPTTRVQGLVFEIALGHAGEGPPPRYRVEGAPPR